jgi:hypothetical protein
MDNFKEFITTYKQNVKEVSSKTMLKNIEEVDTDLLDAGICWLVTDNIRELLSTSEHRINISVSNDEEMIELLNQELKNNKLLIVIQDYCTLDHWFAVIGDYPDCHIVEHNPSECNKTETMLISIFISTLVDIRNGRVPERFDGVVSKHEYIFHIFDRKKMSGSVVLDYIK